MSMTSNQQKRKKKVKISIIVWNKNNHSNNIKVNKYNYEQGEKSRIFMFDLNIYSVKVRLIRSKHPDELRY